MSNNTFSVLMSVYRNDKPEFVRMAVDSVTKHQTLKPNEIIIVVDGPISTELANLISDYEKSKEYYYKVIWLPENKGLGNALGIGLANASNEIVARMDSDDISVPDRFEKQIDFMNLHSDCDVVGGQITEFITFETNIVGKRLVPCNPAKIRLLLKNRCPLNHMSVMMLRSRVLAVGNYMDWHFNEDYYLWIRMAKAGYKFANLSDTLVNVRVGKEMYARRGGWKYFKSEKGLQDYMYKHKMISLPRYCINVVGRFAIQVIMPNKLRGIVFRTLFREQV